MTTLFFRVGARGYVIVNFLDDSETPLLGSFATFTPSIERWISYKNIRIEYFTFLDLKIGNQPIFPALSLAWLALFITRIIVINGCGNLCLDHAPRHDLIDSLSLSGGVGFWLAFSGGLQFLGLRKDWLIVTARCVEVDHHTFSMSGELMCLEDVINVHPWSLDVWIHLLLASWAKVFQRALWSAAPITATLEVHFHSEIFGEPRVLANTVRIHLLSFQYRNTI